MTTTSIGIGLPILSRGFSERNINKNIHRFVKVCKGFRGGITIFFEDMEENIHYSTYKRKFSHWEDIDWIRVKRYVFSLQKAIYMAALNRDWKEVSFYQKRLAYSYYNKLLAIRRVTKHNRGRFSSGIDNKIYNTPWKRWQLSKESFDYRKHNPWPIKIVNIKKNRKSKRKIGILTIKDRVMQTIVKNALEPEWEAKFHPNSFGFRPNCSIFNAIQSLWVMVDRLDNGPWILRTDIFRCFDNIIHRKLLQKIPVFRTIINRWIKSMVLNDGYWTEMKKGIPQGGVLSPLLANITLDGLEQLFENIPTDRFAIPSQISQKWNKRIFIIRYADDFVVIAPSKSILITHCLPKIKEFLYKRGLSLNCQKTFIIHRTEGFSFLGFYVQYIKRNGCYSLFCYPRKRTTLNTLKKRQYSFLID